jgi:hypothetical protein
MNARARERADREFCQLKTEPSTSSFLTNATPAKLNYPSKIVQRDRGPKKNIE